VTDFERFVEPLDGELPCGPDCEYDNDFLALTQAAAGKSEQQFGDTVIPAVDPDWQAVNELSQALLARTKDLRVVASLTLANTYLRGASQFASGLKLALALCETQWDGVHPRIEVDGDVDPYLRMNAIASFFAGSDFSGEDRLIQALRASSIVKQPIALSFRDLEQSFNKAPEAKHALSTLEPLLTEALVANNPELVAICDIYAHSQALRSLVEARVSVAEMPEMDGLTKLLKPVVRGLEHLRAAAIGADTADGVTDGAVDSGIAAGLVGGRSGEGGNGSIQSREDVRRALDRVCEYLEKHEPSNPASLFARRAQRMLNMPFLELMRELSPDAVPHLETLTGVQPNQ
jgi:type VI secretion system protein ImpA